MSKQPIGEVKAPSADFESVVFGKVTLDHEVGPNQFDVTMKVGIPGMDMAKLYELVRLLKATPLTMTLTSQQAVMQLDVSEPTASASGKEQSQ